MDISQLHKQKGNFENGWMQSQWIIWRWFVTDCKQEILTKSCNSEEHRRQGE